MSKPIRSLAAAEGILALVGIVLARAFSVPLFIEVTGRAVLLALAATALFLLVNFSLFHLGRRFEGASGVYAFLEGDVFPLFRGASVAHIVALGSLAGLGEEIFFRGLLQPVIGLTAASLLFGILHGPSRKLWPLAAWAVGMGAALGGLYEVTDNLLVPILAHALYDGLALDYISRRGSAEALSREETRLSGTESPTSVSPSQPASMKFAKAHALGNDFLFVDAWELRHVQDRSRFAREMCDRLRGIGADGLIVFDRAGEDSRYAMKLYNSDGSPAELSGNGLRCLGAYLTHSGCVREDQIVVDTDAGPRMLWQTERSGPRYVFRADLGPPRLGSADVPFELDPPAEPVVSVPLEVDGKTFPVTALWMCNPQCVILTERLDLDELRRYGPRIESHPRFPKKTNVEFCEVLSRSEIAIGIWERGAGETAASGTGSAASAVAAILNGKADERLTVRCPGGTLTVEWVDRDRVFLTGEAVIIADGRYYPGERRL